MVLYGLLLRVLAVFKSDFLSRDSFPTTAWLTRINLITFSLGILCEVEKKKNEEETNRTGQFIMRFICVRSGIGGNVLRTKQHDSQRKILSVPSFKIRKLKQINL